MSRRCDLCGKGTTFGNTVSKSNNKVRRTWKANIQSMRTLIGGSVISIKICARCLKAGKITKHV